jgi:hypothetical protein
MKEAIKFILIYHGVSIALLILSQTVLGLLSTEIFSYAIWLYVFYLIIGVMVFFLFGLLADRYKLSSNVRLIWYIILSLFILNSIPFFEENRILTLEVLKGLLGRGKLEFSNIGLHVVAVISFIVSYLIYFFYKNKFGQVPKTKAPRSS